MIRHPARRLAPDFSRWLGRPTPNRLPPGSELMIASTLGLAGWWAILHTVIWIAS